MPAKVLHLIDSSGFYGAERVIITLCRAMTHHPDFHPILGCIVSKKSALPEVGVIAEKNGIEVIRIVQDVKFDWWNLKKIIKAHAIDIIHTHGYKPSVLALWAEGFSGARLIITCHLWTNATFKLMIYAVMESLIMRAAHRVVAVSGAIKENIGKMGVPGDKVEVIFNGIDLENWQPDASLNVDEYKKQLGFVPDTIILGLFGRLYEQKGHAYLFHALSKIQKHNIELLCVGDGPLAFELKKLAAQLGLASRIHFLGFRSDVKELLQITDLFVMPSLDEGLPMALLEAMAMAKAIVVTPVGAIPLIIDDGLNGVLVSRGNIDELTNVIIALTSSPDQMAFIGNNAQKKVKQQFSGEAMTASYLAIYHGMLTSFNH